MIYFLFLSFFFFFQAEDGIRDFCLSRGLGDVYKRQALDEENRDLLLLIMQEQMKDKGILFVSHDVAALKNLCQNVYVLGAGKIIEHGTMDKLLSSPQTDWMKQFSALSHRESRGEWKWEKL